jgi:hypothetical protein
MGDWPLHLLNARHGAIGYLDKVMAVYRKHEKGTWSLKGALYQLEADLAVLEAVRGELSPEHTEAVEESAARFHLKSLRLFARQRKVREFFVRAASLLFRAPVPLGTLVRSALQALARRTNARRPRDGPREEDKG